MGVYYHDGGVQFYKGIIWSDLYDLTPVEEAVAEVRAVPDSICYTNLFTVGSRRLIGMASTLRNPSTLGSYAEMVLLVEANLVEASLSGGTERERQLYLISENGDVILSNDASSPRDLSDLGLRQE